MSEVKSLDLVDAHHHVWDPVNNYIPWLVDEPPIPFRYGDYRSIRRPYLPADFRADAAPHRILKSVYVETEWNPQDPIGELRWIHAIAERDGLPNAVVAQAWLDREDVAEVLSATAKFPLSRSIRHKPASARSPEDAKRGESGSMDDPKWRDGYALLASHGLRFDLQTPWWHLDAACELARDFPETTLVLNHTGLPSERSKEGLYAWRNAMSKLADEPNVVVKISGIGLPGEPWTVSNNRPIVLDTIAMFGVERCMFASNFPVDSLCGTYAEIFSGFADIVADLSDSDRHALFVGNAERVYDI